ncbi:MAG: sensor histidine kinase [Firmicutes bacterium]|nr:sensor histidine kinase [Bacillota bacterium]
MKLFKILDISQDGSSCLKRSVKGDASSRRLRTVANKLISLMLVFLLGSCIAAYLTAVIFAKNSVANVYTEHYLSGIYSNIEGYINNYIYQLNMFSTALSSDSALYNALKNEKLSPGDRESQIYEILNGYLETDMLISGVQMIMASGESFAVGTTIINDINEGTSELISPTKIAVFERTVTDDAGERYLVFINRIYNFHQGYNLGHLYMYVRESFIESAYSGAAEGDSVFFIMADDTVLSHPDKNQIDKSFYLPEYVLSDRGREYSFQMRDLQLNMESRAQWKAIGFLSYKKLYKAVEMLQTQTALIVVMLIVISVLVVFVLSRSLVMSMSQLQYCMDSFIMGSESSALSGFREIAALENSFNRMVTAINDLIRKNNEEKEKQRTAELKALQAQINPHFIYNALDAIQWHAKMRKQLYIADMIYELASFFRIGLHKGENMIKVSEEIRHVESYVKIEQMRFPDMFEISYKIQDDVLEMLMPKIILQPLVENAIKHGFEDIEHGGMISITGYCDENGDIFFEVEDNGKGMDFDPLILNAKSQSYGVINVHERLVLAYGDGYGLTFRSAPGEGVWVGIRLKEQKG